jgi:hypothetical protein
MEAVKRAKPVQKRLFITVLFANTDAFQLESKETCCRRISLFLADPLEAFSYIALCKINRIIHWHTPCDFPSKGGLGEYF